MHPQSEIEKLIQACHWRLVDDAIQLEYNIHHIHAEWGVLIQSYSVLYLNHEGQAVYGSDFTLHRHQQAQDSDFSGYSKPLKAELWKIIFAIKRRFFEEFKPNVVLHFIDQAHSVDQRYLRYSKYLALPNYTIIREGKHVFVYVRTPPMEEQERPVDYGLLLSSRS